jgi:hypothetical protein
MVAVLIVGLLAMFFAWAEGTGSYKHGLKLSFGLIFLLLALRFNFGNDYMAYFRCFIDVNRYSKVDFFDKSFNVEPGWIFLCRIFKPFGFFAMIAFVALLNSFIIYLFIKKYVPLKYYWFAVFLYVFSPRFMLIHASAMRQALAIIIFIYSLDFLFKKDIIRYVLCIGAASLFHNSALVLLPFFLLGYMNKKINQKSAALLVLLCIILFIFGKTILPNVNQFVSSYFKRYEIYQGGGDITTGIGLFSLFALFLVTLYFDRFQNPQTALVFKLAIISFIFIPLCFIIKDIGRLGLYFEIAAVVVYPIILLNIKQPVNKRIFLTFIILLTTYQCYQFFFSSASVYKEFYGTYHSIFSFL